MKIDSIVTQIALPSRFFDGCGFVQEAAEINRQVRYAFSEAARSYIKIWKREISLLPVIAVPIQYVPIERGLCPVMWWGPIVWEARNKIQYKAPGIAIHGFGCVHRIWCSECCIPCSPGLAVFLEVHVVPCWKFLKDDSVRHGVLGDHLQHSTIQASRSQC